LELYNYSFPVFYFDFAIASVKKDFHVEIIIEVKTLWHVIASVKKEFRGIPLVDILIAKKVLDLPRSI
jgi:hypothetical protein